MYVLPVQHVEGICCAAGDWLIRDNLSLMGLRAGFFEAYALEPYRERSTSLFHRRVAVEVVCGKTTSTVRKVCNDTSVPTEI